MITGVKKALIFALALAFFAAVFPACAPDSESGGDAMPSETAPALTQSPSDAPSDLNNPVFGLFSEFFEVFKSASDGLFDTVFDSESRDIQICYLALMRDEALLAKLRSSVGMLPVGEDSGLFGGSMTGPYAGTGYLKSDGSFSYVFESGDSFEGRVTAEGRLSAEYRSGGSITELLLVRLPEGFLFRASDPEAVRVCEAAAGALRYVSCDPEDPALNEKDVFPEAGGTLTFSDGTVSISEYDPDTQQ